MQGGMLSHRSLHARALRLRESVIARLLLTLVLALSAVGTFQYFIVGNRVEADLIREHAAVHAADARSLELRAAAAQNNRYERPLSEVTEVLAAIAERPDTQDVAVLDMDGTVLAAPVFVPAAGQGALALQVRSGEEHLVAAADDAETRRRVEAERACVAEIGGGCLAPVAAHHDGERLTALVAAEDGSWIERRSGDDPSALAAELLAALP
jgi:HAMP domain-containing protein